MSTAHSYTEAGEYNPKKDKMKKENIYIDLSKCSTDEQEHIFSLLPKDEITAQIYYMIRNMDWGVLEAFNHLFFNEKNVWQICSNRSTETIGKSELTYTEFIKLFDGREVTWNIFKPHTGSTETETMGRETIKSDNTETLANALQQIEKLEAHLQDEINEFSVLGYEPSQYQLGYNSAINDIMEILKPTQKI